MKSIGSIDTSPIIRSIDTSTMVLSKEQIECPDGYTLVPNRTFFLSTDIITEGIKSSRVSRGIMTDYSSNKYICKKPALINFDLNKYNIFYQF